MKSEYNNIKSEWKAEREAKYQSVLIVLLGAVLFISFLGN